ncbi:MAG TPA: acylase [Planctomycetaceae bacterium]|nr:acylase [Planctomycetaceae bacterium]|tara:strand:- start:1589 stop:3277 length:1689 start_codon:yes stop_codon:yes gene_type:complete
MRTIVNRLAFAGLMAVLLTASTVTAADDLDFGDVTETRVMVPMRDGKRLSGYLYLPKGKGPWPGVFEQRYASLKGKGTRLLAAKLASDGYGVLHVNFRGAQESEGTWVGYRALAWGELQDGYDTCEWLAGRKWCTGKIGTFGSSQGGYAQNFLAVTRPPHLACQYMVDTGLSLYEEGYRLGGTTRPDRFKGMDANCRVPAHNRALMAEWFEHPDYDEYWEAEDCARHFGRMNVPCFTIGSWYDFMNQGSIASFQGRQHRGGPGSVGQQKLLIGPWLHGRRNKGNRVGELVYPQNAAVDVHRSMVGWFDHHLKGKKLSAAARPTVRYYVMGAVGEADAPGNLWREARDFPPRARTTSYFLQHSGGLGLDEPDMTDGTGAATSYTSDPKHPRSIPGRGFPGARDASGFEKQDDVLTFTSGKLGQPVEWTGAVEVQLYVSSSAPDTDVLVRISDVYPDGRSILLADYPWRMRYREGFRNQVLMNRDRVYPVRFRVGWMSQIFNTGHRIRVTVASTGSPLYEPNPQTGKPATIEFPSDARKAINTIHHSSRYSSRILAPVRAIRSR